MKRILVILAGLAFTTFPIYLFLHRSVDLIEQPVILGHGGMGIQSIYPLNSAKSTKTAMKSGANGVELDVRMTKDGVLIAFHDSELKRASTCEGILEETLFSDIKNCESMTWLKSEPIESLPALLDLEVLQNATLSLDLKLSENYSDEDLQTLKSGLINLISDNSDKHFLLESTNRQLLDSLVPTKGNAEILLNHSNADEAIEISLSAGYDGIIVEDDKINSEQVISAHDKGLIVAVWGVGSVFDNREALLLNPDIIQTDDLRSMRRLLR